MDQNPVEDIFLDREREDLWFRAMKWMELGATDEMVGLALHLDPAFIKWWRIHDADFRRVHRGWKGTRSNRPMTWGQEMAIDLLRRGVEGRRR